MQWTFGGVPVYSVIAARQALLRLGHAPPADFARANSIINPLGQQPAMGWLLLVRDDLNSLDLNALHDLVITDTPLDPARAFAKDITFSELVITKEPVNLTPSFKLDDPDSLFLVEVADARWRCSNPYYWQALDYYPNQRAADWDTTYHDADNETWVTMLTHMWEQCPPLGPWPGFPAGFSPDGTPEGFYFGGVDAWKALCDVLWKLGLAVVWDHALFSTYSIVQVGAPDTAADALLEQADNQGLTLSDAEFLIAVQRGRFPATVRVLFKSSQLYGTETTTPGDASQWMINHLYNVDVDVSTIFVELTEAEATCTHVLHDELPALFGPGPLDGATPTNLTALETRADHVVTAYLDNLLANSGRMHLVYAGIVPVIPGSTIKAVCIRQLNKPGQADDGGLVTEVASYPQRVLPLVPGAGGLGDAVNHYSGAHWADDQTGRHPPDIRAARIPVYPQALQVIEIYPSSGTGNVAARVMQPQGDGTLVPGESVWANDPNGGTLEAGKYLLGKLDGFTAARPMYNVVAGGAGTTMRWLRVTSTTPISSGYPAQLQTISVGGNGASLVDASGSQDAWAAFPNGYLPTAADIAPPYTKFLGYAVGPGGSGFEVVAMDWIQC